MGKCFCVIYSFSSSFFIFWCPFTAEFEWALVCGGRSRQTVPAVFCLSFPSHPDQTRLFAFNCDHRRDGEETAKTQQQKKDSGGAQRALTNKSHENKNPQARLFANFRIKVTTPGHTIPDQKTYSRLDGLVSHIVPLAGFICVMLTFSPHVCRRESCAVNRPASLVRTEHGRTSVCTLEMSRGPEVWSP